MADSESIGAGPVPAGADSALLIDVVRAVLDRCGGQRWTVRPEEAWCYLSPPDGSAREHGWKLHVSATPLSAPLVLARAGEVLVRAGCAFKFGTDIRRVSELVDQWYSRGGGGKFITVYPEDDEQFRELAGKLHKVTEGLPGPAILSDRQLRPGSLVYYRYGEINGGSRRVFTDDGVFKRQMSGPDGTAFEDERNAWFSPPPWAASPFPDEQVEAPQAPESVLLGGRYQVRKAIRHANKGGVYRAVDEQHGTQVVIKQARAHVSSGLDGTDVRDRLRQESQMLQELQPLGVSPAWTGLMQLDDDLFLIQEQVPGQTLEKWAQEQRDGTLSFTEALEVASNLAGLVGKVHAAGYVIRDLKSSNVMMLPGGDLRLIDVEYVTRTGTVCRPVGTPYFTAPELQGARSSGEATAAADCYSLGATLFHMITCLSPAWLARKNGTAQQDTEEAEILARIACDHPALSRFTGLILGLTETDPGERWTLSQARDQLTALFEGASAMPVRALAGGGLTEERLDNLIDKQACLLQTSMTPGAGQLWKSPHSDEPDVCSLWNGAAGGLAALTRAAEHDATLSDTVAEAAAWISQRLSTVPRLLPGLAFGRAGTAWALHDAGRLLKDTELQDRALELAAGLPTRWPIADITHGLSGAGMTHLHLWHTTGNPESLDRALACAQAVLDAAQRDGDGNWTWPVPADTDSVLAGNSSYGYAHGTAGTGAFLLSAAQAAGHHTPGTGQQFYEAALGAGDTLARAAVTSKNTTHWPRTAKNADAADPETRMFWCNGAAGIGSFLIRLHTATREQRFADLAEQAAATITRNPWPHLTGACCGLAGAGHFLLDMAHHTGHNSYHHHARTIAAIISNRPTTPAGARSFKQPETDHGYQNGTAGTLTFHLRLRHNSPHPWTPGTLLPRTP
ncbi:class IV lanthionine synthetase LanL [Streptomyces sp. NPDC056534]|uniref:class IV lanthionine synthetase LanL n=1 Tax=Streptomyces sp. NPDC056534 TaxID=3345857 RepID=UPI0036A67398